MFSTATGKSPMSVLLVYKPRTQYILLKYGQVILPYDKGTQQTAVWVLNHNRKFPKYIPGSIFWLLGVNTYLVHVSGQERVYHRHQMRFGSDKMVTNVEKNYRHRQLLENNVEREPTEMEVQPNHKESLRARKQPSWFKDYIT